MYVCIHTPFLSRSLLESSSPSIMAKTKVSTKTKASTRTARTRASTKDHNLKGYYVQLRTEAGGAAIWGFNTTFSSAVDAARSLSNEHNVHHANILIGSTETIMSLDNKRTRQAWHMDERGLPVEVCLHVELPTCPRT